MAVVAHNEAEVDLLARLMRAEAEGDGDLGMLMVGNTGINRVLADCLDFTDIRTITNMVFQSPGGFEATQKAIFIKGPENQRNALQEESSKARCSIQLPIHFGSLCLKGHVLLNGMANGIPADSYRTAFMLQLKVNVLLCTGRKFHLKYSSIFL